MGGMKEERIFTAAYTVLKEVRAHCNNDFEFEDDKSEDPFGQFASKAQPVIFCTAVAAIF
jgi:hypothetical protein